MDPTICVLNFFRAYVDGGRKLFRFIDAKKIFFFSSYKNIISGSLCLNFVFTFLFSNLMEIYCFFVFFDISLSLFLICWLFMIFPRDILHFYAIDPIALIFFILISSRLANYIKLLPFLNCLNIPKVSVYHLLHSQYSI